MVVLLMLKGLTPFQIECVSKNERSEMNCGHKFHAQFEIPELAACHRF